MCIGCLVTCRSGLGKRVATLLDCIFGGALRVLTPNFWGESLRSNLYWLYLIEALLKALFTEIGLSPW
jgi:hypothetical protein